MSAFANCLDILDDFLVEAGELLEDVDMKLVELESAPTDGELLNCIFRGFHTIKGGGGFLEATPLVELCHKTENLFDQQYLIDAGNTGGSFGIPTFVAGEPRRLGVQATLRW